MLPTIPRPPVKPARAELQLDRFDGRTARLKPHEQDDEVGMCAKRSGYFIDYYLTIDDAQDNDDRGTGTMPFRLWDGQKGLAAALQDNDRIIALKARQLGISWVCCGHELWLSFFSPNKVCLLFSKGQAEANELLRRVKVMYERLPEWLRRYSPLAKPPNKSEIEFANGSRILSLPASEHAGSSWTASSVLMDEYAKVLFAEDLFAAVKPTIDGGGQLIIVSTAFGIGNKFHALWTKAAAGENDFVPIFMPWWMRPGRDQAWYDRQVAEETDPGRVKENYPATATEAFRVSGNVRFHTDWIEAQTKNLLKDGMAQDELPENLRGIQGLVVYGPPEKDHDYLIGADVAEGLEHGDHSAAVVIDRQSWVEKAMLCGHWEPDEFAEILKNLAEFFGALIAPERNNHGHAVIAALKLKDCYAIWRDNKDVFGWLTNVQTKPAAIDLLAEALRDGLVTIRTAATLDELQVYRREANGKTSAPDGYFDDRVMAWAIALAATRFPREKWYMGESVAVPKPQRPVVPGSHMATQGDQYDAWHRRGQHADPTMNGSAGSSVVETFFRGARQKRDFYGRRGQGG
jgi:hypothetical protein